MQSVFRQFFISLLKELAFACSVKNFQLLSFAIDSNTEPATAAIIIATISMRKRRRKRRSSWVKP